MMKRVTAKLNWEQTEKLVTLALEEKILLKLLKEFGLSKKSFGNNEKEDAGREI
jgi:hypothetical protein